MGTTSQTQGTEAPKQGGSIWVKALVRFILFMGVIGVMLFWPAGSLRWVWGWAFIGIYGLVFIASMLVSDAGQLEERINARFTSSRDKAISAFAVLAGIVMFLGSGFDERWGWSGEIALWLHLVAMVVVMLGLAVGIWARYINAYFAATVRIQDDRGHQVVTGGPYRLMRHPGYSAAVLIMLALPVMFGSWWALIPGGLSALAFVLRTAFEDRTLQAELPGYAAYAEETRYRLLPGIW